MLISKVSEETGDVEGREGEGMSGDFNHRSRSKDYKDLNPEYRTASELFELMTKNTHFELYDDDILTTSDLVLLYKNLGIGTKLMNDDNGVKINELVKKKPNQHVETIVYNDDQDSNSDLSEIFSNEDVNLFRFNQERIDFLTDNSFDNLLCQKIGGVEINSSAVSTKYNNNFMFKDPYIKDQLINLNMMNGCGEFGSRFSSSLIDYICCKRLEDNYNFYMDNVITYVQHTIDQLKRISNGDYLTEKVKEKWREVNSEDRESNMKVLATSTSIPLHVECKNVGNVTWDDIVHSEVDVRSLSKILEKKIVLEIPKLICGSYRLYSKRCNDNLIISCQREKEIENGKESRVDVVLQLERSQTGQVISNISSIMILQTSQALPDIRYRNILPLPYKEDYDECSAKENESKVTEIELEEDSELKVNKIEEVSSIIIEQTEQVMEEYQTSDISLDTNDYPMSENDKHVSFEIGNTFSSESSLKEILNTPTFLTPNEGTFNLITPDELRITMQRLNVPTSLLEEIGEDATLKTTSKRKSPIRVRVKSPYENKSFLLEEKKRKRLLEIRERREKKKMALIEKCKISKHNKYGKGSIMPQASSSVTKLSISNKSFYNSIYGQSGMNVESKNLKGKIYKVQQLYSSSEDLHPESPIFTPEQNKNNVDGSYNLDNTDTAVMFTQFMHRKKENNSDKNQCSPTNSAISIESNESNEFNSATKLKELTDINKKGELKVIDEDKSIQNHDAGETGKALDLSMEPSLSEDLNYSVPKNSPMHTSRIPINDVKKNVSGVECRKSIDKLYELMKTFGKPNIRSVKSPKSKIELETINADCSLIQNSESDAIVKQPISSYNPNSNNNTGKPKIVNKKNDTSTVVPKVIMSSKLQTVKADTDIIKKDRRKMNSPKAPRENPLKAISQLLHKVDNLQKTRQQRPWKRIETPPIDDKNANRQNSLRRRSRYDQHMKDDDQDKKIPSIVTPKDRRLKPLPPAELARIPHQRIVFQDKLAKKKIADIIDEAKEARGEAVRGPSKLNSRLSSLAQPRKSYVQTHSEEYQNKYGRNMANRLQRPAVATPPSIDRNVFSPNSRIKTRKFGGVTSTPSVKHPSPQLEKHPSSPCSSPTRQCKNESVTFSKNVTAKCNEAMEKMVAVESYVKSHYGRSLNASPSNDVLFDGHKSRVPLIPTDFEWASMASSPTVEEANEIGSRLHRMISILTNNSSSLTKLTEYEHDSKISKSTEFLTDRLSRGLRRDSDYCISVLEDKNLKTAVETVDGNGNKYFKVSVNQSLSKLDLQPVNSLIEMKKLENALYNQISGAFQKRLRMKNITLTPKHSIQQVFLVQSGDASSILVKTPVSSIKINENSRESMLEVMPVLSKSHFDSNFTQIPMQITTIGYAFPEYHPRVLSSMKVKELKESSSSEHTCSSSAKSNEINQCFKCVNQATLSDRAAQVDAADEIISLAGVVSLNHNTFVHKVPVKKDTLQNSTNTNDDKNYIRDNIHSNNTKEFNMSKCSSGKPNCSKNNGSDIHHESAILVDNNNCTKVNKEEFDKRLIDDTASKLKNHEQLNKLSTLASPNSPLHSPEKVEHTTSLDMLVGLLNEIQKITGANQMPTDNDNQQDSDNNLDDAAYIDNALQNLRNEVVSISSLDKLRQLESDMSIFSLCNISNDESNDVPSTSENLNIDEINRTEIVKIKTNLMNENIDTIATDEITRNLKKGVTSPTKEINNEAVVDNTVQVNQTVTTAELNTIRIDKEVSADLPEREFIHISTSVSPDLGPLTITRSANVSSSFGVISEPSMQSMLEISDCQTIYSKKPINVETNVEKKAIIELLPKDVTTPMIAKDNSFLPKNSFTTIHKTEANDRVFGHSDTNKYCMNKTDLDPMLKIKRDILVTIYSILVFTVFAALSFPNLIYLEQ